MSEQENFLKDLEVDEEDVLNKPIEIEGTEEKPEPEEDEGFKAKNRRERRLLEQNQRLREEAIANSARLQGIQEAQKLAQNSEEAEFLKIVEPIYGTDTPEKAAATELLKKAFKSVYETAKKEAKEETLEEVLNRESESSQAVAKEEETLEDVMDHLEEEYGANFSDPSTRKGFFTLLEQLSPKDREGNIIEFADPDTTYKIFQSQKGKSSERAKEIASRSMVHSGEYSGSTLKEDATQRYLRENGII